MAKPYLPFSVDDDVPDRVIYHSNLDKLDPIVTVTHYLPVLLLIVRFNIPPSEYFPPIP